MGGLLSGPHYAVAIRRPSPTALFVFWQPQQVGPYGAPKASNGGWCRQGAIHCASAVATLSADHFGARPLAGSQVWRMSVQAAIWVSCACQIDASLCAGTQPGRTGWGTYEPRRLGQLRGRRRVAPRPDGCSVVPGHPQASILTAIVFPPCRAQTVKPFVCHSRINKRVFNGDGRGLGLAKQPPLQKDILRQICIFSRLFFCGA